MKQPINPLYPGSNSAGLTGSYQQAAFMDDTDATFSQKSTKKPTNPTPITPNHHRSTHQSQLLKKLRQFFSNK